MLMQVCAKLTRCLEGGLSAQATGAPAVPRPALAPTTAHQYVCHPNIKLSTWTLTLMSWSRSQGTGCDSTCSDHGLCGHNGTCICAVGFYGKACATACPSSGGLPCAGHTDTGSCDAGGICTCQPGWYGTACDLVRHAPNPACVWSRRLTHLLPCTPCRSVLEAMRRPAATMAPAPQWAPACVRTGTLGQTAASSVPWVP